MDAGMGGDQGRGAVPGPRPRSRVRSGARDRASRPGDCRARTNSRPGRRQSRAGCRANWDRRTERRGRRYLGGSRPAPGRARRRHETRPVRSRSGPIAVGPFEVEQHRQGVVVARLFDGRDAGDDAYLAGGARLQRLQCGQLLAGFAQGVGGIEGLGQRGRRGPHLRQPEVVLRAAPGRPTWRRSRPLDHLAGRAADPDARSWPRSKKSIAAGTVLLYLVHRIVVPVEDFDGVVQLVLASTRLGWHRHALLPAYMPRVRCA